VRYKLHEQHKTRCKRLYGAALQQGKNKSLASTEGARQKKSPATSDRVKCFLFAGLKKCAEKPEEKQDTR